MAKVLLTSMLVMAFAPVGCCEQQTGTASTEAMPAEPHFYKDNVNLPGSDVATQDAAGQATLIFVGHAVDHPGVGSSREFGLNYHGGKFVVQEVLLGETSETVVEISYLVQFTRPLLERAPRKGECVIVFLRLEAQSQRIIKMLLADDNNKSEVMSAVGEVKKSR